MNNFKRTLITTALPYANGPIHIGHLAGVYVPADIYARYLRLKNEEVLLIGGSDEHGVPITLKAKNEGVTPQDIVDYKLPTHPLKEVDIKRAKDALKNDPFVKHHKSWQAAINQMLNMGQRVEQQAFAKHGLDFVVNKYLPAKLKNPSKFLP